MLIFNKMRVFYRFSLGLLMIFILQHTNDVTAKSAVKPLLGSATETNDIQSDTSWKSQSPTALSKQTPLPFFVVLDAVLTNHPVLKQSKNYQPIAEAELSIAKGAFDPMISYYRNNKNEGSKLYQNQNLDVYIPNYFGGGISINNPYSVNSGAASGSLGLEIDFPLLKGLITDYRRTYLAKSKINVKMSIAQRDQWVNDLVQDVFLQYSQWLFAHETAVQIEQVLKIAEERQQGLRKLFTSGAGTAVDTWKHMSNCNNIAPNSMRLFGKKKSKGS
jgi:outer membrane protein TolC